ncbi:MAG TPA: CDP-glucose 4,6-dehydratase [Solirubrobacteraceae bacterium]|jgi:CDP-glucose 4,6-dehydratase|nr:CDP-glucose 4,6-dehydratase [Solirubrobacteraceae bacterium]
MALDHEFWTGRRVLITGHTGFKGAWLSLWLQSLGADVTGLAGGPPTTPSLYELARVGDAMTEHDVDVRDARGVREAFAAAAPEVVVHLAGQPIVRRALEDPLGTLEVNVMGTANVLDAARTAGPDVRAVVVVTTDKCYAPANAGTGAVGERAPLGGEDPYSTSKACAELVTAAFRRTFFAAAAGPRVATARTGNVIGGGDWGRDRLVPDIVRAVESGSAVRVRNPAASRPWQHVLNPLSGYLLLAQHLWQDPASARAWNFGPPAHDTRSVSWLLQRLAAVWNGAFRWEQDGPSHPVESTYLELDAGAARRELGWRPAWDLERALRQIVAWHTAALAGEDMRRVSLAQLERFGAEWSAQPQPPRPGIALAPAARA